MSRETDKSLGFEPNLETHEDKLVHHKIQILRILAVLIRVSAGICIRGDTEAT